MSGIRKDLSGQRFGRLVAIKRSDSPSTRSLWTCKCDCGKIHDVLAQSLIPGLQKSCGCLRDEISSANGKATATHGMTRTPKWSTWNRMLRFAKSKGILVCHGLRSHPNFLFEILPEKPIKNTVKLISEFGFFSCGVCASCRDSGEKINIKWGREPRSDRRPKIDLSGSVFNRLTAIEYTSNGKWRFQCSCGNICEAESRSVKRGLQQSCGCLRDESAKKPKKSQEEKRRSRANGVIMHIWRGILSRCLNPDDDAYKNYGGRGITPCAAIAKSHHAITDSIGPRPDGRSIDRIDNDLGYTCGQCEDCSERGLRKNMRWATSAMQARNTRRTRWVTIHGRTMCLRDWAREIGILEDSLRIRIKKGWCDDDLVRPRLIPGVALG